MSGDFVIKADDFKAVTRDLEMKVRANTLLYGQTIARQYTEAAKKEAPWTDRKGNARRGFKGSAAASGATVRVTMGAQAPNYKKGPNSAADYMEYLEFAHGGKYAAVYPTVESMRDGIVKEFGNAALRGKTHVLIQRDKAALRKRKARYRREKK